MRVPCGCVDLRWVLMLLLALTGIARCGPAVHAADITVIPHPGSRSGGEIIRYVGPIEPADVRTLAYLIQTHPKALGVDLDSDGGSVQAAIRAGELVRLARLQTDVPRGARCASACFFIWLNGSFRVAGYAGSRTHGPVGLHRPYLARPENSESSLQAQSNLQGAVIEYLERHSIPRRLIDLMMTRSSAQVYWLDVDDFEDLGDQSADLQELYMASCGRIHIPAIQKRILQAESAGDSATATRLNRAIGAFYDCTAELDWNAREALVNQLRAGWLPPTPMASNR